MSKERLRQHQIQQARNGDIDSQRFLDRLGVDWDTDEPEPVKVAQKRVVNPLEGFMPSAENRFSTPQKQVEITTDKIKFPARRKYR